MMMLLMTKMMMKMAMMTTTMKMTMMKTMMTTAMKMTAMMCYLTKARLVKHITEKEDIRQHTRGGIILQHDDN